MRVMLDTNIFISMIYFWNDIKSMKSRQRAKGKVRCLFFYLDESLLECIETKSYDIEALTYGYVPMERQRLKFTCPSEEHMVK